VARRVVGRHQRLPKELVGCEVSAKDFRTWHGTVLAAVALAGEGATSAHSRTGRAKAVRRAIEEVAGYLGNTAAVSRKSYVDPRVVDRYEAGDTIASALHRVRPNSPDRLERVERAVLRLLRR
jgi:DNA topoisomerase IB